MRKPQSKKNAQHPIGPNPVEGLDLENLNLKVIILRGSPARAKVSHAWSTSQILYLTRVLINALAPCVTEYKPFA